MKNTREQGVIALSISSLDENTHLTPQSTLLDDLVTYLSQLKKAITVNGVEKEDVFFDSITEGCTQISARVTPAKAAIAAQNVFNWVNNKNDLKATLSALWRNQHRLVVQIPDKDYKKEILPIEIDEPEYSYEVLQTETFRGKIIRIGGKDKTVPLTLLTENGEELHLNVQSQELAKKLGRHLFDTVECTGFGKLVLDTKTMQWKPKKRAFSITNFKAIEDVNYDEWLNDFRAIKSDWRKIENPVALLANIRKDDI